MPRVDVVVCTYQRPAELVEALMSISNQTATDWHCWICEDGDSVANSSVIRPFLEDVRFTHVPGTHAGIPAVVRNRGIRAGKAPFVAFIDDDDRWFPDKLEAQLRFLSRRPEFALVGTNALRWTEEADWDTRMPRFHRPEALGALDFERLVQENMLVNSSVLLRRNTISTIGLLDESTELVGMEDYQYWLRASLAGMVYALPEPYVVYRDTPDESIRQRLRREDKRSAVQGNVWRSVDQILEAGQIETGCPDIAGYREVLKNRIDEGGRSSYLKPSQRFPRKTGRRLRKMAKHAFLHLLGIWGYEAVARGTKKKCELTKSLFFAHLRKQLPPTEFECIIFSKDRPLQLHGLLRSLALNVIGPLRAVHVLYSASNKEYHASYQEVIDDLEDERFQFTYEQHFRTDLLALLRSLKAQQMFFLVDDMVFVRNVDLDCFSTIDLAHYVPSLRLGRNLTYSYARQSEQALPVMERKEEGEHVFFSWTWGKGIYDWGYPLSVDGHIFSTGEIIAMTESLEFSAPNSFEDSLQECWPYYSPREGLCLEVSVAVNICCNRVQNTIDNRHGDLHQDTLLHKWQQGYRLDIKELQGICSKSVHEDRDLPLCLPSPSRGERHRKE